MRSYVVAAVVLAMLFAGWAFFVSQNSSKPSLVPSEISGAPYTGAPLERNYKNDAFGFALNMPDGFSSQELPVDELGASTVLLQNPNGEGIQIRITPYDDLKTLTAEMIREQIPDMQVLESEPVTIGADYTGVAFISDNEAFEGRSREVWFVFRGNLYQISTYARLDALLKAMFATWTFS